MNWLENIPYIIIIIIFFTIALIVHLLNKWKRWGKVESESIEIKSFNFSDENSFDSEILFYNYLDINPSKSSSFIILLSSNRKFTYIIDQYAIGLCLSGMKTVVIRWKENEQRFLLNFSRILEKIKDLDPNIQNFRTIYLITSEKNQQKKLKIQKISQKINISSELNNINQTITEISVKNHNETMVLSKILASIYMIENDLPT